MSLEDFEGKDIDKIVLPFRKVCVAFGKALYFTVTPDAPTPDGGIESLWEEFADEACSFINSLED